MDQNLVKTEDGANLSIKFEDENLQARLFDVDIKIESEDLNFTENSLESDFKIKEDIDIGPTELHKPSVQYDNSDTSEKPPIQQPKKNRHSQDKSTAKKPENLHTCSTCGKGFIRPYWLKRHQETHLRVKPKLIKMPPIPLACVCPHCPEKFKNMEQYNQHLRECHKENQFKCDNCRKTFDKKYFLTHHECGQSREKSGITSSGMIKCPHCTTEFTNLGNYNRHIREFHNKESFKCNKCGKKFKRQYSLKRHQDSGVRCNVRTGNYTCFSCGKKFSRSNNLARHKTGYCDRERYEGVYVCDICDKGFPNRTRLMVHIGHHKRLNKVDMRPLAAQAADSDDSGNQR